MFLPEEILVENEVSVIGIGIGIGAGIKISCCLFGIEIPKIWGAASTCSRKKGWGYEVSVARSNDKVRRRGPTLFGSVLDLSISWSLSCDLSLCLSWTQMDQTLISWFNFLGFACFGCWVFFRSLSIPFFFSFFLFFFFQIFLIFF